MNKRQLFSSLVLLTAMLISAGCGKKTSQDDLEKETLRATVSEKETTLTPLAGRYEGTLTSNDGSEVHTVTLQLVPTIMIVQNPGRNDVTEMPTLGGNLNIVFDSKDKADVLPIAQFTNAMFAADSGHLRLTGSINTGTTVGTVINTLDGHINGPMIKGHLSNSTRGDLGLVEVRRVNVGN
jgi:hypothetical protein